MIPQLLAEIFSYTQTLDFFLSLAWWMVCDLVPESGDNFNAGFGESLGEGLDLSFPLDKSGSVSSSPAESGGDVDFPFFGDGLLSEGEASCGDDAEQTGHPVGKFVGQLQVLEFGLLVGKSVISKVGFPI